MTSIALASTRIAAALLASLPLLPLFAPWQLFPVTSFHQEWLALAAGVLACLCAWPLWQGASRVAVPAIVWLPLALAGFIGLQSLLQPQIIGAHAGMAVCYLLWAAWLIVLVGVLQQHMGRQRLSHWLAFGLLAAAIWASGRELAARFWAQDGVWGGTGQPNHYGDLLALGGAALLYLRAALGWRNSLFACAGLVLALGLSLTPSRSVWLYALAMAAIRWRYRPGDLKPLAWAAAVYLILQVLWSADLFPTPQTMAAERLVTQTSGSSPRWHIWQVAWDLFLQRPLLGHGFGEFDWAYYQAEQFLPEQPTRIEHAHNIVMHMLAEMGLLPVVLLLGGILLWLRWLLATESVSNAQPAESENPYLPMDANLQSWVLMSAAVLTIHSLLEYPLWHAHFLGVAACMLAIGDRRTWTLRMSKAGAALAGGVVSVALAVAVAHEWQYTRLELALLQAMAKQNVESEQHLINICQSIPETAPLLKPYIPVVFTLTGHPENPAMREQLSVLAEAAVRFTPSQSLVYRLALLQALNNDKANARKTLHKAMTAYPGGTVPFAQELLRAQAYAGPRIDVLMERLLPLVNAELQANLPAGIKAKVKQATAQ